MKKGLAFVLALASLSWASLASATVPQECQARVLQPVTDDLGHAWKAGAVLPVTLARDDANGGTFCAHGGSCLPRMAGGTDAVALLNCKVGPALGNGDWRLVPDPQLAGRGSAAAMRSRDDAEKRLSDMGFSNASAGSLADEYVGHPGSKSGRLVARALAGSASALAALKRQNP